MTLLTLTLRRPAGWMGQGAFVQGPQERFFYRFRSLPSNRQLADFISAAAQTSQGDPAWPVKLQLSSRNVRNA